MVKDLVHYLKWYLQIKLMYTYAFAHTKRYIVLLISVELTYSSIRKYAYLSSYLSSLFTLLGLVIISDVPFVKPKFIISSHTLRPILIFFCFFLICLFAWSIPAFLSFIVMFKIAFSIFLHCTRYMYFSTILYLLSI